MRKCTVLAGFYSILEVYIISAAVLPQMIKRTKTKQAIKLFRIVHLMTGKIFTLFILKKLVVLHIHTLPTKTLHKIGVFVFHFSHKIGVYIFWLLHKIGNFYSITLYQGSDCGNNRYDSNHKDNRQENHRQPKGIHRYHSKNDIPKQTKAYSQNFPKNL